MDSLLTLVIYFLFGTVVVIGIGVYLQLRQQHKEKISESISSLSL